MHNMSHATCAYLGYLRDYQYIYESVADFDIKYVAYRALVQSANAVAKENGVGIDDLLSHAENLLYRFTNKALEDTVARVGNDTKRKLSAVDRLPGAIKLATKLGLPTNYMVMGLAAGLHFDRDDSSKEVCEYTKENGVAAALKMYSEITDEATVALCTKFYNALCEDADSAMDLLIHS
jgi:mannitol-1-phosphate 5-dehydrogenase